MKWLQHKNLKFLQSALVTNSIWGVFSNVLQVLFVSLFFVVVARKYSAPEFAEFLIATTVYQLVVAFSSMGLGQWFIREYDTESDKLMLTSKFLKTQVGLGILFYLVNIGMAYAIYPDGQIRLLCIILGTNIIFDNFINAIKSLNIAEFRQKKTATILVIDGFLKLVVGCLLFVIPFSIAVLSALMIAVRIVTLSLFLKVGAEGTITLSSLIKAKIDYTDLKKIVIKNWQFIVIGSISIIYWRIANIIISKMLTLADVANYEIAYRVFSIFGILPLIAGSTIFPQFIKYYNQGDFRALKKIYKTVFLLYTLFALISYLMVNALATDVIPLAFGSGYPGADLCLKQMFLTFLVLPTVLLQANLIVAIGLESKDMLFNLLSFAINVAGCFIGLHFFSKSLAVINYSIFASFLFFHIAQDMLLISKKITTPLYCLGFYVLLGGSVLLYHLIAESLNPYISLFAVTAAVALAAFGIYSMQSKWTGDNQQLEPAIPLSK
ncbi:MAG: hypothetical protein K0S09_3214 [Sphingobacteriaceae bacterium]|nr:hypothetical protein [Sphingobacteriaceae bacterium]